MKLAEIYLKAAEVIRTNGHYKGAFFEPSPESGVGIEPTPSECRVCAAGALSIVLFGQPLPPAKGEESRTEFDLAVTRLNAWIEMEGDPSELPLSRLAGWNDSARRTADDVIAALENAAKAVA